MPQGCDLTGTPPCTAWYTSYAIYDWRWYSQLMVSGTLQGTVHASAMWEVQCACSQISFLQLQTSAWPLLQLEDALTCCCPPSNWLCTQAILNIMRSLFLLMLFGLGAYFLNHDTRRLVLKPIERMVQRLQDMAENPLKVRAACF